MRFELTIGPKSRGLIANWFNVQAIQHPGEPIEMRASESSGLVTFTCGDNELEIATSPHS